MELSFALKCHKSNENLNGSKGDNLFGMQVFSFQVLNVRFLE